MTLKNELCRVRVREPIVYEREGETTFIPPGCFEIARIAAGPKGTGAQVVAWIFRGDGISGRGIVTADDVRRWQRYGLLVFKT